MNSVLRCDEINLVVLEALLARYRLQLRRVEAAQAIPGSYWGDAEAGLIGNQLWVRADTPVHSALHEACHFICMDAERRSQLHTDAAGDYAEENGVCYLQILLADYLPEMGRARMLLDMDRWGYSFRLGSSQRWFETDAEDAQAWLVQQALVDGQNRPTWRLRDDPECTIQFNRK